jgi:hypothetical protein
MTYSHLYTFTSELHKFDIHFPSLSTELSQQKQIINIETSQCN